jgi:hypothetical protein
MRTREIDSSVKDLEHAIKVLKHARMQPNVSKQDRRSQEARQNIVCACMIPCVHAFKRIMPIQSVTSGTADDAKIGSPEWTILESSSAILCQA